MEWWKDIWPPVLAAMIGVSGAIWIFLRGRDLTNLDKAAATAASIEERLRMMETSMTDLKVKVETMWLFQLRRGVTEAVNLGIATKNSPLHFSQDALARLDPIKADLIQLSDSVPNDIKDSDFMLLIEEKFGAVLVDVLCIPCGLSHAACLLIAFAVAKKQNPVDFSIV